MFKSAHIGYQTLSLFSWAENTVPTKSDENACWKSIPASGAAQEGKHYSCRYYTKPWRIWNSATGSVIENWNATFMEIPPYKDQRKKCI